MSLLGYENFLGEDEFSVEFIEEGKTLMKRGRKNINNDYADVDIHYRKKNAGEKYFPGHSKELGKLYILYCLFSLVPNALLEELLLL